MKVLGICGSLRAASLNAALLRTAQRLAPQGMQVSVLAGLGELPLFNPDLEPSPPAGVVALRHAVASSAALLIASPEYAHGVSGVMKNALDWLVSDSCIVDKPVALLNASPRAHHAWDALAETLATMSARLVQEACVSVALLGAGLDEEGMVRSAEVGAAVGRALRALRSVLAPESPGGPSFPVLR